MAESHEESIVETIRDLKRREPFAPFWIVMTSGDRLHIDDPDALAIGSSQLFFYPPKTGAGVHMRLNQIAVIQEEAERRRRRSI